MLKMPSNLDKSFFGAVTCIALSVAAGSAVAATPFQTDVSTAIDRGIEWLANQGVYNNPSTLGINGASGLAMQALLEKRASGNASDPPQGYTGASATDQGRLRTSAAYILDAVNESGFYAYRDGQWMFALSGYALTGGPDKSVLAPANADYQTIKQAMDAMVDRTLANQRKAPAFANAIDQGYWCYTNSGCEDSSTTQFAAAGLEAARTFYKSNKVGDAPYADPARVALIDTALALVKQAYELNALNGSDYGVGANANCQVLNATERGHGYSAQSYRPSLQQTASGIYIQLFGGADVNSPMVQNYMQWVRNRYRYTDLDSLGNSWPGASWSYYLWSSFKAMELMRQAGIATAAGNLSPDSFGTLAAAGAPLCNVRQENKTPAAVARPASFGAGGVGFYSAETKSQYFDYASQILSLQCFDGSLPINGNDGFFGCNSSPGAWENTSHQAYQLLVLQRSTGNVVQRCDIDADGDVDSADLSLIRAAVGQVPGAGDPRDATLDGKITINDVRACTLQCTRANCATS